jgi:hypothetical protein
MTNDEKMTKPETQGVAAATEPAFRFTEGRTNEALDDSIFVIRHAYRPLPTKTERNKFSSWIS